MKNAELKQSDYPTADANSDLKKSGWTFATIDPESEDLAAWRASIQGAYDDDVADYLTVKLDEATEAPYLYTARGSWYTIKNGERVEPPNLVSLLL
jgi:hypothetical protein